LCGRDEGRLNAVVDRIGGGTAFVASPLDSKATEAALRRAQEEFDSVDGVANCVGSLVLKGALATKESEVLHLPQH
jgi:NADP-dependent 3-hydroxy acid dehydrogenase YdfG